MSSVQHERERAVIEWAAVVLGTLLASAIAFLLTQARCGALSGAGTPAARSAYCRALGAPGLPSHLPSVLLFTALFAAAPAGALAGAVLGRGRLGPLLRRCAIGACTAVAASYVLILAAHASFPAD